MTDHQNSSAGSEHPQISFLREAANYFRNRPTHGEDRAFWSNVANADNCEKAANLIERMLDAAQPVAWRYRHRGDPWSVCDTEPEDVEPRRLEVQPLYAAPPAAAPIESGSRLEAGCSWCGSDKPCDASECGYHRQMRGPLSRCSADNVDAIAKTIWLSEFERAFSRTPSDPWENQSDKIKDGHRLTARRLIDGGFVIAAQPQSSSVPQEEDCGCIGAVIGQHERSCPLSRPKLGSQS